jgi:hypothetical protein
MGALLAVTVITFLRGQKYPSAGHQRTFSLGLSERHYSAESVQGVGVLRLRDCFAFREAVAPLWMTIVRITG